MSDIQQKARDMVYLNVIGNRNELINYLQYHKCSDYEEELYDLGQNVDWEETFVNVDWDVDSLWEMFDSALSRSHEYTRKEFEGIFEKNENEAISKVLDGLHVTVQDALIDMDIDFDPEYQEVLEYWEVSDWLRYKLINMDEVVEKVFGMHIWGRTTTGQVIYMDYVIQKIATEWQQ